MSGLLSAFAPLIIWLIKKFVKKQVQRERLIKNYYTLLAKRDEAAAKKVSNHIDADDSLKALQLELRETHLYEPDRFRDRVRKRKTKPAYRVPEMREVPCEVKTHGQYLTDSGKPRGLVIHYTAGRSDSCDDAVSTLSDMAMNGYGCLVMDHWGRIFQAQNQGMNDIAWHAGRSERIGYTGLSRYCLGMEICCAGRLDESGKTWWGKQISKYDLNKTKSETIMQGESKHLNPGTYHKFTAQQESSLINFILWQLDTNPEFDLSWVMGHDEISPGRKTDPGGSLSMTMPAFRDHIRGLLK